jgi:spore germination cell wall hydrolase CwlJ-like protein
MVDHAQTTADRQGVSARLSAVAGAVARSATLVKSAAAATLRSVRSHPIIYGSSAGVVVALAIAATVVAVELLPIMQAQEAARLHRLAALKHGAATPTSASDLSTVPVALDPDLLTVAPDALQKMGADQAKLVNDAIPISTEPNPAAAPFVMGLDNAIDSARALDCMTAAIYYEAANQPLDGQRAIAQVVINRMRHPAYPKTVCGVVFQGSGRPTGCQFTFTCDGSLTRTPAPKLWATARAVAHAALSGYVFAGIGHATHYHTVWVVPYWNTSLTKVAVVGAHVFFRWNGGWGLPPAFRGQYAGNEPAVTTAAWFTAAPPPAPLDVPTPPKFELAALTPVTPPGGPTQPDAAPKDGTAPAPGTPTAEVKLASAETAAPAKKPPAAPLHRRDEWSRLPVGHSW